MHEHGQHLARHHKQDVMQNIPHSMLAHALQFTCCGLSATWQDFECSASLDSDFSIGFLKPAVSTSVLVV